MSKRSKILVVDDQPEHLHTIEKILNESDEKYDIVVASNGEIACRIAKKELPDLIVMDWDMPLMNGIEAAKCICADRDTKDIPIVITTGVMMSSKDMKTAFEAGATEYLRKPIEGVELITRVRSMLKLSQKFKEVKYHQDELEKQNIELKEKNEELDAFNHTVAHDLKNPLNNILSCYEVLNNEIGNLCSEDQRGTLNLLGEITLNMSKIISALLLFSSVGKADAIKYETIDSKKIIDRVLKHNEDTVKKRKPELEIQEPIHKALGYEPWIEEVWSNLLSNAFKYGGDPLKIKIGSELIGKHVRFLIINNGTGLTEEEQEIIFKQFTRGNVEKIDGHGLGLSIVSRIIKKLNGEVGVKSGSSEGTMFYFTLLAEGTESE